MAQIIQIGGWPMCPELDGLAAWYDASALNTVLNAVGPDTPAADTQTVQQWSDRSGNGNHLQQATAGSRPTFHADAHRGMPCVRTNGSSTFMLGVSGANAIWNNKGFGAVIAVVKYASGTGNRVVYAHDSAGAGAQRFGLLKLNASNTFYSVGGRRLNGDSFAGVTSNTVDGGNAVILSGWANWANSDIFLRQNGDQVASSTSFQGAGNTTASDANSNGIGRSPSVGSNFFGGDFFELVIYNATITLAQIYRTELYLSKKWGIPVS